MAELGAVRGTNGEYVDAGIVPDGNDVGLPVAVEVAGNLFDDRRNATVASLPVPRGLERRAVGQVDLDGLVRDVVPHLRDVRVPVTIEVAGEKH
jgi:hypothetical protein